MSIMLHSQQLTAETSPDTFPWVKDKRFYTHCLSSEPATKRNKLLIHGITWMSIKEEFPSFFFKANFRIFSQGFPPFKNHLRISWLKASCDQMYSPFQPYPSPLHQFLSQPQVLFCKKLLGPLSAVCVCMGMGPSTGGAWAASQGPNL